MIKKICIGLLALMLTTPAEAVGFTQPPKQDWSQRIGVRFGYAYINHGENSPYLQNPSMFTIGFEGQQTMKGGEWLDLLFIENITIGGLEQSVLIPSLNMMVGFEINNRLQLGVGANAALSDPSGDDNYLHLVTGVGWTQPAGAFSVPVHVVFMPDINDYWRLVATTGVNW